MGTRQQLKRPSFGTDDSEETLWQKMFEHVKQAYGVTSMLYAFTHSKYTVSRTGIMPSIYLRHNYPDDYLDMLGGELSLDDSVAAKLILDGRTQLFWNDFPSLTLAAAQQQRLARDKTVGMNVGVSFGFRFGANSGYAALCLASRHGDAEAFKTAIIGHMATVETVAQEFQLSMRNAMISTRIRLTPREKEVLSYSAGGMTAKQIATHLGLSEKTITNTLERARNSLGAVSTMEAVAKALVYELIQH